MFDYEAFCIARETGEDRDEVQARLMAEHLVELHKKPVAELVEIIEGLYDKVESLEDENEFLKAGDVDDDDDVVLVDPAVLERVRREIVRGDYDYAVELIGREIGY